MEKESDDRHNTRQGFEAAYQLTSNQMEGRAGVGGLELQAQKLQGYHKGCRQKERQGSVCVVATRTARTGFEKKKLIHSKKKKQRC